MSTPSSGRSARGDHRHLSIREVDPFDPAQFEPWHAAHAESQRHGREATATVWTLEEFRVQMQDQGTRRWAAAYSGFLGGRLVVAGYLATPLLDNLEQAEISIDTVPAERGRGHATEMLAHLEQVAREHGRSSLLTEAAWPYDGPADGAGEEGAEFLRHRGFELGLVDIQRSLSLPVADELLDHLAEQAAPHHTAYTLRSWVGPVPDDLVQGWAALSSSLMTEAPTGDIDREPETPDVAVYREGEAMIAKQGRTKFNTAALDADGVPVAYSDIAVTVHEPGKAYQWGTLVRRADRGHRLGLAVKVANLRQLQRESPGSTSVVTWNAEVNAHMVGVNVDLGFVATERMGEFQKRL